MNRVARGIFFLFMSMGPSLKAQQVIDTPERLTPAQILARADSLHRAFRFEDAIGLYLSIGEEGKAAVSQNALNMTEFCADPHVVARQRFSRKDFFLYYPLPAQAWRMSPHPLDSLPGHPLYFPKGADVLYFSAPDRSGSRSLFVTENLDSLWRAPRHLGEGLLSAGSEIYPMLSPDGKTLYFASDGLSGMGGYDLYSSTWDEESAAWSDPVNMGFPFSSPADDFLLVDTPDGKYTLFASNRDCSPDSVYIYVLDFGTSRQRKPVHRHEDLVRISSLTPSADPARIDNGSAVQSGTVGNANTRLYIRKMEEVRVLLDSISVCRNPARLDSLRALLEEVNLELRLVEQTFLQSGVVTTAEDREVVGADLGYTFAKKAPGARVRMKIGKHSSVAGFRVAPVGRFAPDNTLPPGIVYQIELFSSPRHATLEEIHGLTPVYERLTPQLRYTYSVGTYPSYAGALLDLNLVRSLGFPGARITAWRDGRPIPINLARQEE